MKKDIFEKNIKVLILLFIITCVGFFLRTYKLTEYPVQLGQDDVSQLYDAISISETGKDINNVKYPFIFKSLNDNKPSFYIYSTVIAYKLFGWNDITIRVVGVFYGTLLIPIVYLFTNSFFKRKSYALLAAFFTAITPFEIFYARKAFENQAGICFILLGLSIFLYNFKKNIKPWYYFIFPAILALGAYTYFSHAILIPLIFISLLIIFRLNLKEASKLVIIFLLAIVPLWILIIKHPESTQRAKDVSILQDRKLGGELSQINTKGILGIAKKYYTIGSYSFYRYISHFSPKFLFVNGLQLSDWDVVNLGPFYWWQLPLLLLGFVYLIKSPIDNKNKLLFLFIILICLIPSGTTFEDKSPHRIVIVFTLLDILIAFALIEVLEKLRNKKLISLTLGLIGLSVFWCFIYSILIYTRVYAIEKSEDILYPYKQVSEFAWQNYAKFKEIIFDPKFGTITPFVGAGAQYYLAYYGHYPPSKMQSSYKTGDQLIRETYFDKFHIQAVFWPTDSSRKNTLIIASPWSLPDNITSRAKIIKTFRFYKSDKIAFWAIELD